MAKAGIKLAAITRTAFEYQDLIGIELLINFYREPQLYHWVEVESEEDSFGYIDDVVAARKDGTFEYIQAKFTPYPEKYLLGWDWLLEKKPKGTSRLQKWCSTLADKIPAGQVHRAELRTNRTIDEEFGKSLVGGRVSFSKLTIERRTQVIEALGNEDAAKQFFSVFTFVSSTYTSIDEYENRLKGMIVPTDTTSDGWLLLRSQVRRWATHKKQPEPDGKILHQHLVQIITKQRPRPIPQNFAVPPAYALPSDAFHHTFQKRIKGKRASISVLWGTPGKGKSTYLSYLARELSAAGLPVVRHHYFLSLEDTTADRISFSDIAYSLMHQIQARYPEAITQGDIEESPNQLRKWIAACGDFYASRGKKFYVVVDGLDHVWREQQTIEQMNHLFNYLLPCPKNVVLIVGTQRVADSQLPTRLLANAGPSAWIEIPPMDENTVYKWISAQYASGRLRLDQRPRNKDDRAEVLNRLGNAFYGISKGHPLHLIYSFEALIRRGVPVSPDEVKSLPRCPDGDIRRYYRTLWGRTSSQGRKVIHLIAGSDFRWPTSGLRQCAGSLDEVDHLLEHRRTGVLPFHGSILAFAREQSDHESTFNSLLPNAVKWLEEDAPEYWTWGWLWIMKAKLGREKELVTQPSRKWVIGSLAAGWPHKQINTILRDAETRAFAKGDYSRAIELRSFKTRVQNGPEFQMHRFPSFLESSIRAAQNSQQALNLADDIGALSDAEIAALSRALPKDESDEIGRECCNELARRTNVWLALRHRPGDDFRELVKHMFEAFARHGQFDPKKFVKFVSGFRDGDDIFLSALGTLVETSNFDALAIVRNHRTKKPSQHWRCWTEDALVRCAALEGVDPTLRLGDIGSQASPLLCCWLVLHGHACPADIAFEFDRGLLARERYEYGRNTELEQFFHGAFFSALASFKAAPGDCSFVIPGVSLQSLGWLKGALETLFETAKRIAAGSLPASFATVYDQMQKVEPVAGRHPTESDSVQYWSLKAALRQIAIDLHLLGQPVAEVTGVTREAFALARASRHWDDGAWLDLNLAFRRSILQTEAAADLLTHLTEREASRVTVFNERIERWTDLALFTLLYGMDNPQGFVRRAADGLVGYGYHKDPYAYEVLDSIAQIHRAGAPSARTLLTKVAPIIDQIMDFTDGDDIRGTRSELVDLIASICPNKLPDCYAHHIAADEWELAEDALEAHAKLIEYDDELGGALARTFLGRRELLTLSGLAEAGKPGASVAFKEQQDFVGGLPPTHEYSPSSRQDTASKSTTKFPDVSKFPPTQFPKLFEFVTRPKFAYDLREESLAAWLRHWTAKGKGPHALKSIEHFFKTAERTYSAEKLLDDVFNASLTIQGKTAAYKWLVTAQIARHGWQSYWTSEKEVIWRLETAAKHYKDRWKEFIRDSSKPQPFYERRNYGFSIGLRYLVHFLLLVGQKRLAFQYTETLTNLLVDELKDQPIPKLEWL